MLTKIQILAEDLAMPAASIEARGLRTYDEATELELVEIEESGREHYLMPAAAHAWRKLKASALADNIELAIVSAFRSVDRQADIIRQKLAGGQMIDEVLAVCAPPGYSEHHTGRAVDISTAGSVALDTEFEQTAAFAWLVRHAEEFGFRLSYPRGNPQGYIYEPWHWCFHVSETACRLSEE